MNSADQTSRWPTAVRDDLDDVEALAIEALVEEAERADRTSALNEHALLHLRSGDGVVRHVLGYDRGDDDPLVAYVQLDRSDPAVVTAECVVHPAHRQVGWGSAVVDRALDEVGGSPVLLWSHGDHPGAARMAKRLGFTRVRDLWQLRRQLGPGAAQLPKARLPEGVAVRTFEVGRDEDAWLRVNARAFAQHPEQGEMDAGDLSQRIASAWFDPAGFFLAERAGANGTELVGFHWTKVHGGGGHGHEAIGEVYVVGVDPGEQGNGLGSALTLIGLRHLADRGLSAVLLYVEADNTAALRVYQRLGFEHVGTDTQYRHPGRNPHT